MSGDIGPILEDLAAGRIDAAEASRRIEAVRNAPDPVFEQPPFPTAAESSAEWHQRPQTPGVARESFRTTDKAAGSEQPRKRRAPGTNGVDRISVRAVGRPVRIVGDSGVATASAEGPHVLRRDGSVLEVSSDGDLGPHVEGFSILRPGRGLEDLRSLGIGKELYLRVNPSIVVDVEVTAGLLTTQDVPYLGKVRVTAGSATLDDVAEAADVLVQAGQVSLRGTITSGRSRVRCESGSVSVRLGEESSVVVKGEAQLGRIVWSGSHSPEGDEVTMGAGAARLDVSLVMGYGTIAAGRPAPAGTDDAPAGEE